MTRPLILQAMPRGKLRRVSEPPKRVAPKPSPLRLAAMASEYKPRIDWDAQPLGEVPVAELARLLGVSTTSVVKAHKARGIAMKRVHCEPKE